MRAKVTFKEYVTFTGIPREEFKPGDIIVGEIITRYSDYIIILPDDAERQYCILTLSIKIEEEQETQHAH